MALRAGIPRNYLAKVLRTLAMAGLFDAARGRGGGYQLSRSAASIPLAARACSTRREVPPSASSMARTPCSDATGCAAHDEWRQVKETHVQTTALATLAARREEARALTGDVE